MLIPRPSDASFDTLRRQLEGPLLTAGDPGYDAARSTWNSRFDARPAAVAQCAGPGDVAACVRHAKQHDMLLCVKSSGHDYAGKSVIDGALVIDLSRMSGIRIDPARRRARVEPGVTWGVLDREAQEFGLATTGATVSTVSVSGYTLGGGTGHLMRNFGLGLDNLRSAEVVTADGRLLHASDRANPDLFWGIRGGGGNLGVVTSFEFALHELGPQVLSGQIFYPLDQAGDVLRFWRDFMAEAPDEIQAYAFFINLPPLDDFPAALKGQVVLDLVVTWSGAVGYGERALQPLRSFGRPALDTIAPLPYVTLQRSFDAGMPKGLRWHSRAHYFDSLSNDAIDTVLSHVDPLPGAFTAVYFEPQGGAVARVPSAATAFPHRDAAFALHIFPGWSHSADDSANAGWADGFHRAMEPHATGGVYVNLLARDEQERVPAAYGVNCDRLARVKAKYDPANLFRSNQNVPPAR